MIDRAVVQQYADQAQNSLRVASQLSSTAQIQMESTKYKLCDFLPGQLALIDEFAANLHHNHDLVLTINEQILSKIKQSPISSFKSQYNDQLIPAMEDLNSIVNKLKTFTVPSFVLENHDSTDKPTTFGDFISLDAIKIFQANIDIYKSNCFTLIDFFDTKIGQLLSEPLRILNKHYNRVVKQLEELVPIQLELKKVSSNGLIGVILRENASLEKEVLSLLEMLTNHYDQCVDGVKLLDSANASSFNFEVLKNDSLEMPDVLKELTMVCDLILQNEERGEKLLNVELPKIDLISNSIKDLLQSYRDFKLKNVPQILITLDMIESKFNETTLNDPNDEPALLQYTSILNQLSYHYSQTLSVYQTKYLKELHREQYEYPRILLSKITQFLTVELAALQEEEFNKRQAWMKDFGDFIPKEFKSPAGLPLPTVRQIDTKGLEYLQNDIVDGELTVSKQETRLLDHMAQMNTPEVEK